VCGLFFVFVGFSADNDKKPRQNLGREHEPQLQVHVDMMRRCAQERSQHRVKQALQRPNLQHDQERVEHAEPKASHSTEKMTQLSNMVETTS
jgi:hypothetical protein